MRFFSYFFFKKGFSHVSGLEEGRGEGVSAVQRLSFTFVHGEEIRELLQIINGTTSVRFRSRDELAHIFTQVLLRLDRFAHEQTISLHLTDAHQGTFRNASLEVDIAARVGQDALIVAMGRIERLGRPAPLA